MKLFNSLKMLFMASLTLIVVFLSANLTFAQTSEADELFGRAYDKTFGYHSVQIDVKEGFSLFQQAMEAGSLYAQAMVA